MVVVGKCRDRDRDGELNGGKLPHVENSRNVKMCTHRIVNRGSIVRLIKVKRQEWSRSAGVFRGAQKYRDIRSPSFSRCPA